MKRERSASPGSQSAALLPKRRRRAQYFSDPYDHAAESVQQGLKVVQMEPVHAMDVGYKAVDLMVTGSAAASRIRQAAFRTHLAKALSNWVLQHRRAGAELLDPAITDAAGRIVRRRLTQPLHVQKDLGAWIHENKALEKATERPYTSFEEFYEDMNEHRMALVRLAATWKELLKTAQNVGFYVASEETLLRHQQQVTPAAMEDCFIRQGELGLTRHLITLTGATIAAELSDTDPSRPRRAPLLWLGQGMDDADRAVASVATPSAAAQAHCARRGRPA